MRSGVARETRARTRRSSPNHRTVARNPPRLLVILSGTNQTSEDQIKMPVTSEAPTDLRTLWMAAAVAAAVGAWSLSAVGPTFAQGASAPTPSPSAPQTGASQAAPAQPKELTLTESQIQHVLDAQKEFDAIADKMPKDEAAKPDPKIVGELEATAKKHGFADYADYNNVVYTLSVVLNGFDPKTKTYVGPEAVLKQQLAAVQADTKIPANDKKAIVAEINTALKSPPPPVANKANIEVVTKYYDKIAASLQEE